MHYNKGVRRRRPRRHARPVLGAPKRQRHTAQRQRGPGTVFFFALACSVFSNAKMVQAKPTKMGLARTPLRHVSWKTKQRFNPQEHLCTRPGVVLLSTHSCKHALCEALFQNKQRPSEAVGMARRQKRTRGGEAAWN